MYKRQHVFLLYGDNSDKENAEIRVKLKQIPENESLILVATGQKIGEGFDFPRLDLSLIPILTLGFPDILLQSFLVHQPRSCHIF